MVMKTGKCQDRYVGRNHRSLFFGVPRLSRIGESHSLDVPQDLWRSLGLDKLVGLPPVTELRFLAHAKHLLFLFRLGSLFARANLLIVFTQKCTA